MTQEKGQLLPYRRRIGLLTPGERRFFHDGLKPAVGEQFLISFKVRLADVITVDDWGSSFGRKIAQKHVDFVLVTPKQTRITAVIELNDATHLDDQRKNRDEFLSDALQAAGIPFIVFPVYRQYNSSKIRQRILDTIARNRRRIG